MIDIRAEHEGLIAQLRAAGRPYRGGISNDSYTGSGRPFFNVGAPDMRRMTRAWLAAHRSAPDGELLAMADSLFAGEAYEERILGALLLGYSAKARRVATPAMVEGWLAGLNGWAEIDSLCASVFRAQEMAAAWPQWRAMIERLSGDANINKRRAALVLLTTPTRTATDGRFAELAYALVERLKGERPILITKAISWLLRSMAAQDPDTVSRFLDDQGPTLPAIAVRETRVKIRTGTKSGRPSGMGR
ncbi:MAG: DNA alkylation repair protein [Caulobacterales bacterium]